MDFTFAELLRSFRERASLTQTDLADALGVHRNTVSAWERGQYRPYDREIVLRLSTELALAPSETDQFLRAADFPSAHGTPVVPTARHQLRPPVADFVGRADESARLVEALRRAAAAGGGAVIVAIHGMGGIGKTELAYRAAAELLGTFPDAQIVVELRGASDVPLTPEQALQTVIRSFTPEAKLPAALPGLQALYRSTLHGRRALILADDARDAAHVRMLTPPSGCALLITSRQRFTLPGMLSVNLEQLGAGEAAALLREICDRLSAEELRLIGHACGYLPLALRVCASILRSSPALPVADYIARLADTRQSLPHLRDPDDPQLDVEATLALSYGLLDDAAQSAFRELGVLAADFATPLARAVVAPPPGTDAEGLLHMLLRRNLVLYDEAHARWRLHSLVRALALRYLEAAGEADAAYLRYARAMIQTMQELQRQYLVGGDAALDSLARFDAERPHLDEVRRWLAGQAGTASGDALILEDAAATYHIGDLRSNDVRRERIPQLQRTLAAARRLGDQIVAWQSLNHLGTAYGHLGELELALDYFEQALAVARASGDQYGEGVALTNLGNCMAELGDSTRAIPYYQQAIACTTGDQRREANILSNLTLAYIELNDTAQAIATGRRALACAQAIGNRVQAGYALSYLARAYAATGDAPQTNAAFEQALALLQSVGDRYGEAECRWHFGLALLGQGAPEPALAHLRASLSYEQEIGHARAAQHAAFLARLDADQAGSR